MVVLRGTGYFCCAMNAYIGSAINYRSICSNGSDIFLGK